MSKLATLWTFYSNINLGKEENKGIITKFMMDALNMLGRAELVMDF